MSNRLTDYPTSNELGLVWFRLKNHLKGEMTKFRGFSKQKLLSRTRDLSYILATTIQNGEPGFKQTDSYSTVRQSSFHHIEQKSQKV